MSDLPDPPSADMPPQPAAKSSFLAILRRLAREHPVASAASGVLVFIAGWVGTNLLDTARDFILPDAYQIRAETLRDQIATRTSQIENQLAQLDGASAAEFEQISRGIIAEFISIQPRLAEFAQEADELGQRLAEGKASELATSGSSRQADLILAMNEGVTLCPTQFSVGLHNSLVSGSTTFTEMTISSASGNTTERLTPGENMRHDEGDTAVAVSYLGPSATGDSYRYNFTCLSL